MKDARLSGYKDSIDGSTEKVPVGDYSLDIIIHQGNKALAKEAREFKKIAFPECME